MTRLQLQRPSPIQLGGGYVKTSRMSYEGQASREMRRSSDICGISLRGFPRTPHGHQRPGPSPLAEKTQAPLGTAAQGWSELSALLWSSCSSLTRPKGPERSGSLRRDGTPPRDPLTYPPDHWIALSSPPCSVSSTSWQRPP